MGWVSVCICESLLFLNGLTDSHLICYEAATTYWLGIDGNEKPSPAFGWRSCPQTSGRVESTHWVPAAAPTVWPQPTQQSRLSPPMGAA